MPGGECLVNPETGHQFCAYPDMSCPDGMRWSDLDVEDGISGMCVDIDEPDAGVDAPPDGPSICPTGAPVQNGQAADLVLGQTSFTAGDANSPFESGSSMSTSRGVFTDGSRLWVGDAGNARVLQWNSLPVVNGQTANVAIGQAALTAHTAAATQDRLGMGGGWVFRTGSKLIVSDSTNNRVLIWNSIPTTNGAPADLVLGQPNFITRDTGGAAAATNLYGPAGVWSDGTKLIVADRFNNRVLIWTTFPTANQAPADIVLGWSAFGTSGPAASPPTASSLRNPIGVFFDGTRLYVADESNNRVLVWNGIPTANGTAAALVLGQGALDLGGMNGGSGAPNAIGFRGPTGVTVDDCGAIYVCDMGNNRVLVHAGTPSANGEPADAVLGKPDFTTPASAQDPITASSLAACDGVMTTGANLYVADSGHNRVLRFNLSR
jgi:sugar lactone lactonase YvrE